MNLKNAPSLRCGKYHYVRRPCMLLRRSGRGHEMLQPIDKAPIRTLQEATCLLLVLMNRESRIEGLLLSKQSWWQRTVLLKENAISIHEGMSQSSPTKGKVKSSHSAPKKTKARDLKSAFVRALYYKRNTIPIQTINECRKSTKTCNAGERTIRRDGRDGKIGDARKTRRTNSYVNKVSG